MKSPARKPRGLRRGGEPIACWQCGATVGLVIASGNGGRIAYCPRHAPATVNPPEGK